jgi:hypothetical protein
MQHLHGAAFIESLDLHFGHGGIFSFGAELRDGAGQVLGRDEIGRADEERPIPGSGRRRVESAPSFASNSGPPGLPWPMMARYRAGAAWIKTGFFGVTYSALYFA